MFHTAPLPHEPQPTTLPGRNPPLPLHRFLGSSIDMGHVASGLSIPALPQHSFCDLGCMSPLSQSQFCCLNNEHDACLAGSDVHEVTPEATRQNEQRRRGTLQSPPGPGSPGARVGGTHRGRPDAPRWCSGHSSSLSRAGPRQDERATPRPF